MGIGTSLGAYFEDDFQHQAGVPTLPKGDESMVKKPKDTGDDNVLPPDEGSYDKSPSGLTRVRIAKPAEPDVYPEPDYTNPPEDNAIKAWVDEAPTNVRNNLTKLLTGSIDDLIPKVPNRLSILNAIRGTFHGAEDAVKNSPQHLMDTVIQPLQTIKDVSEGKIPMTAMDPDTGEIHTTVEGMEAAWKLLPYGIGGRMPKVQLRGPAAEALSQVGTEDAAHQQFQQLLRQVRRNQPSIIQEGVVVPERIQRELDIYQDPGPWDSGYRVVTSEGIPTRWRQEMQDKVLEAKKSDKIKLVKDDLRSGGRDHEFKFASKDGIGQLNLTEKKGGKELYIDVIGKLGADGHIPWHNVESVRQSFGHKEIMNIVRQLMVEFPKAEEITGFRVSGARIQSGRGESKGSMRIPGRGKKD